MKILKHESGENRKQKPLFNYERGFKDLP